MFVRYDQTQVRLEVLEMNEDAIFSFRLFIQLFCKSYFEMQLFESL